jgi:lysophospholipase L1-like esterase
MKICIFGDSIVWGSYDYKEGGWVNQLKNYFIKKDVGVYNLGISGENTEKLLLRIKSEAKAREASVIIFAIGINDTQFIHSKNSYRLSEKDFKKNIKKIYEISRDITKKIIFIGITNVDESRTDPIPWGPDKSYKNERIDKFNMILENFCFDKKISFISLSGVLEKKDLYDGLHPNPNGHSKILKKIKRELLNSKIII